jgi:hypothetical protein
MSTLSDARCAVQASKIVPALVWSGLGICALAATIYDLRDMFGW